MFFCSTYKFFRNRILRLISLKEIKLILRLNKRNDKRFNNRGYSLFFLMDIFLKHLWLIPNLTGLQEFCQACSFTDPFLRQPPRVFSTKKVILKICEISQENDFIKKRLQHRCFPVKFRKFLKTPTLKNICERLLLPYLGFTKLNYNVFLWLSWRHRFLYNSIINC